MLKNNQNSATNSDPVLMITLDLLNIPLPGDFLVKRANAFSLSLFLSWSPSLVIKGSSEHRFYDQYFWKTLNPTYHFWRFIMHIDI